jgi:iron complex outermembrane receptor protein
MSTNPVLAAAIAAALLAPAAYAQAQAQEGAAAPGGLEEIVVTAQKREELAQKTAISMSVYTGDDIAKSGVHNIAALANMEPSLNVTASNGAGYMAVRGVASTDITEIGDPAVSISRDGFFMNRSYSIFSSLYDVERIEVLKGPQGTLQGRNTTGGAVNIITKRPDTELGGYAAAEVGDYNALDFEGAVNVPLGDKVQVRLSGITRQRDGYRDNSPAKDDGDDEDAQSIRLSLAFQPFENFTGLLQVQHDKIGGVGDVAAKAPFGVETKWDSDSTTKFPLYTQYKTDLDETRFRWEFAYSGLPAGMTLTYLGGYDDTIWKHALDATADPNQLQQFIQEENPTTQNHELRLTSNNDSALFWQVGLFYFKEKNSPLDSGLFIESGPFADQYLIRFNYNVETESKAAFGQVSYNVTDAVKLSAGVRYTEDSKTRTGDATLDLHVASGGFLPPGLVVVTPGNGNIDDSKPTYHAGIDWQVTDQNLVYLKYDTGFKSGGFNSNGSAPSVPYGPETVDAIELGTKNRFLSDTLQLNAAAFYQKYKGYQAAQSTPALGGGPGVQNAGDADIYGLEAELLYAFGEHGRFNVAGSWLDTKFTEFTALSADGSTELDLSGNELPNAPDLSVSAGIEYGFGLFGGTLTPRLEGKYTSSFNYSFFNFPDTETDPTTVGNAMLTYEPGSAKWNLQAYVRNFTDEVVFSRIAQNNVVHVQEYQFAPPRTYGLRFQYNF